MSRASSIILFIVLMFSSQVDANEETSIVNECEEIHQSYKYVDFGVGPLPLLVPLLGYGYRLQYHHHGADVNFEVETVWALTKAKFSTLYLYYSKPNQTAQFYTGFGAGVSAVIPDQGTKWAMILVTPEWVYGKEYLTDTGQRRFLQVQMGFPGYCFARKRVGDKGICWLPLVEITYGIGF